MKMLLIVSMPHEKLNNLVKEGKAGQILNNIIKDINPVSSYFTEMDGKRTGLFIINIDNPSDIPKYTGPFYLNFNADCKIHPVMSLGDLQNAGLDELAKKWS